MIPVHAKFRKYLRFRFNKKLYQYTVLPFGICTAPLVFTKLLKPVISLLRSSGLRSVVYLDDFLLLGNTYTVCSDNVLKAKTLLESLGFVINQEKSKLDPSTNVKFLGFSI